MRLRLEIGKRPRFRLALCAALALGGCATGAPERDVFVPPYAEKGCWARLYGAPQFAGAVRQLEGPVYVEALSGSPVTVPGAAEIPPQPLFSEARSLELGPHARLQGYAAPLFRQPSLELAPGARVPDLGEVGFGEKVQSFRLSCAA